MKDKNEMPAIVKDMAKPYKCCESQVIESGIEKYPLGLPLDRITITYCSNCHTIHNVEW